MSESSAGSGLERIEAEMKKAGWSYDRLEGDEAASGTLLIETDEPDCLMELFPDGRLACQFGVDMEEMRNLLTGDQTEDMQDDELVRVARYHLKAIVDRYRVILLKEGMEEGVDATAHYYAIIFDTRLDLENPQKAMHDMARFLLVFEESMQNRKVEE